MKNPIGTKETGDSLKSLASERSGPRSTVAESLPDINEVIAPSSTHAVRYNRQRQNERRPTMMLQSQSCPKSFIYRAYSMSSELFPMHL